jgi:hypothetical protein
MPNTLEKSIPFGPELHNEMAIYNFVENFSAAVLKALATSTRSREDTRPPILTGIQDEMRLKTGCEGSGRSPGTPF